MTSLKPKQVGVLVGSLRRGSFSRKLAIAVFPVISGKTGTRPIFAGAAEFDLELVECRTLNVSIQELIYRPTLHVAASRQET